MAVIYLRSTDGNDADSGATWALAKATLAAALTAAGAGGTVYVSKDHAETQASAMTLTSPGTAASPCRVLCVDDAGNPEPPTVLATAGSVATGAGGAYTITFAGYAYYYGIAFTTNPASTSAHFVSTGFHRFEQCSFYSGGRFRFNDNPEFVDCDIAFASASNSIETVRAFTVIGGSVGASGTVPTTMIMTLGLSSSVSNVLFRCVDLSAFGAGKSLVSVAVNQPSRVLFTDCKLGSSVSVVTGTHPGQVGPTVTVVNCDSADTNYRYQKTAYQGSIYSETTVVRTGGATDGATPISRKMVTSANSQFFSPLESDPIAIWNETVGSSLTATVEVVTDGVTLTDAECWAEVEYLGTSGFPLSLLASDRAADILATPANQASSAASWTTTGLGSPVTQKLSVSFTPQEKGLFRVRVMLAKPSTTVYVCPRVDWASVPPASGAVRSHQDICGYQNAGVMPAIGDVKNAIAFGAGGTEYTGTYAGGGRKTLGALKGT